MKIVLSRNALSSVKIILSVKDRGSAEPSQGIGKEVTCRDVQLHPCHRVHDQPVNHRPFFQSIHADTKAT